MLPTTIRNVVCVGDSVTWAPSMPAIGVTENWVEQLAHRLEQRSGPRIGDGFRGLWRETEWSFSGTWTETTPLDPFDVAPFHSARYSSGSADDELVWTKPERLDVAAFDLYSFALPNTGRWQYRVDNGAWTSAPTTAATAGLMRIFVDTPIRSDLTIRSDDGAAPIAGIATYRSPRTPGLVVHNLGYQQRSLAQFCRPSEGDPFALLDELRPELVTILFTNDVRFRDPDRFAAALQRLIARVHRYGVALVLTSFEQRVPRTVDDAVTVAGSPVLTSASATFLRTDVAAPVLGPCIARGATIERVHSPRKVEMSAPAERSSDQTALTITGRRTPSGQATYRAFTKAVTEQFDCPLVDLYEAFSHAAGGWDAAYDAGFMYDGLHPTQAGHDLIARCVADALHLKYSESAVRS